MYNQPGCRIAIMNTMNLRKWLTPQAYQRGIESEVCGDSQLHPVS